ncbi:MAG: zinc ABC transporter substrate-binding protein [Fusobacteriales bacterium]|nr:zinc ABC transporter substrate-binding protein [Fusobacteriales bacterium]
MSKILKYLIICFIFFIFLFSCQNQKKSDTFENAAALNKKPHISVSIPPLKWITGKIAGSDFTVTSVVSSNISPELFDPSVKTIQELEESDLYFSFDLFAFEHKLEDTVSNPGKIYNVLKNSSYLLKNDQEPHTDDRHNHGNYDLHVWFSVNIDSSIAENIKNILSEKYPEKKDIFEKNYSDFILEINSFNAEVENILSDKKSKIFVIYHPALTYFAEEYSLIQISVEQEGKEPTARYLKNIINELKKNNVKVLLVQPQFPKSSVDLISKEVPDIKIMEFNPLEENIFDNLKKFTNSLE